MTIEARRSYNVNALKNSAVFGAWFLPFSENLLGNGNNTVCNIEFVSIIYPLHLI